MSGNKNGGFSDVSYKLISLTTDVTDNIGFATKGVKSITDIRHQYRSPTSVTNMNVAENDLPFRCRV